MSFFYFHESFLVHSDYDACQEHLTAFKKSYSKVCEGDNLRFSTKCLCKKSNTVLQQIPVLPDAYAKNLIHSIRFAAYKTGCKFRPSDPKKPFVVNNTCNNKYQILRASEEHITKPAKN